MKDQRERTALLAEADLLLLLARVCAAPDAGAVTRLVESGRVGAALLDAAGVRARGGLVLLRALADAARTAGVDALALEHVRLFDGAIACPIDESAYVRRDKGHILADVSGFYRAFGFANVTERGEKLDHLATELEFLGLLLVLEAQAIQQGLDEQRATTRRAIRTFAEDHVGAFLPAFTDALRASAVLPFHGLLAESLALVWECFCARRGVEVDAPIGPWRRDGEAPMECGGAGGTSTCPDAGASVG